MNIEIKNRWTGAVIFSGEYEILRLAVIDALAKKVNLSGSDLRGSNLSGSKNIPPLVIARTRILPAGTLVGYKKAYDSTTGEAVIVELEIPKDAKRTHAFGRKCRAEKAIVINMGDCKKAYSSHDSSFTYEIGQTVTPKEPFSEQWTEECASGIHFWITREEAEAY